MGLHSHHTTWGGGGGMQKHQSWRQPCKSWVPSLVPLVMIGYNVIHYPMIRAISRNRMVTIRRVSRWQKLSYVSVSFFPTSTICWFVCIPSLWFPLSDSFQLFRFSKRWPTDAFEASQSTPIIFFRSRRASTSNLIVRQMKFHHLMPTTYSPNSAGMKSPVRELSIQTNWHPIPPIDLWMHCHLDYRKHWKPD